MSVDVDVEAAGCCDAHSHNFTYNYTPALQGAGFPSWSMLDNLPAHTVGVLVGRVILRIKQDPARYTPLIRGGGSWGTVETLLSSLDQLLVDLDKHPDGIVRAR